MRQIKQDLNNFKAEHSAFQSLLRVLMVMTTMTTMIIKNRQEINDQNQQKKEFDLLLQDKNFRCIPPFSLLMATLWMELMEN